MLQLYKYIFLNLKEKKIEKKILIKSIYISFHLMVACNHNIVYTKVRIRAN